MVTVSILDKDYQIACPPESQAALVESAQYLDRQMRTIRSTGKVIGAERIAVMAALNISHELLQSKQESSAAGDSVDHEALTKLEQKIDSSLARLKQLEI